MSRMANKKTITDTIDQLKKENSKLQYLAETDWLTGIYNRGAVERKINTCLHRGESGIMIVFDLDYFKQVNDRYGHIAGDRLLQHIGKILSKMYPQNSLVGRVGGDEFVIFLPPIYSEQSMDEKCSRIKERFQKIQIQNKIIVRLDLSIAWSQSHAKDNYKTIFDRVDQKILAQKLERNLRNNSAYTGRNTVELEGIRQDVQMIACEMNENKYITGAYCQDYDTFKILYQLELRRMQRHKKKICLILFTLLDKNNDFLSLETRDSEMKILGTELQENLRLGDVFTQYSSSQFLVMAPDVNDNSAFIIAERIKTAYYDHHPNNIDNLILHESYPIDSKCQEKQKICE